MSASWSSGRLPELTPARHISPATDWPKVMTWLGVVVFSLTCWTIAGLLIWWAA